MSLSPRFRFSVPRSSAALRIFIAFFVIYAVTSSGGLDAIDAELRYQTAKSWLAGNAGALPLEFGPNAVPGRDGHQYSFYGPLQSVLMTPFIAIIERIAPGHSEQLFKLVFGVVAIPLITAISLAALFQALRTLRFDERAAFWAVCLVGLATPMWYYGRSGQEENIIGLAFALYLWGIGQLFEKRFDGLRLIAIAASIVFATRWSYLPTLAIILVPVPLLLWEARTDWRSWLRPLVVGVAFASAVLGAVLWYNAYRFGSPLETGYGVYFRIYPPFFTFDQAPSHAAALVISPYRGLIWFCPALLLLFGLMKVPKGSYEPKLWRATLGAWIFTWLFIASFSVWTSGAAWSPRYLIAPIVLLAPAFASVFASGQRWLTVIAISIVVQFCSTLLPSSSEAIVYDTRNAEHPGTCTPWTCSCSALCLRGPWAARAIANTISSRDLPVVELKPSAKTPGGISELETSDFNSVYWWPVRAAYRAHLLRPAVAFALCMVILGAACSWLWYFYRSLPRPLSYDRAKPTPST